MIQTIVLADDSATARMIIRRCLEIGGLSNIRYYEARDGVEALDYVKNQKVDLVVTDLNMPNMDGQLLLKHIKASPRLTELPVLVISSACNEALETELLADGALAVLNKPVTPAGIVDALASLTEDEEDFGWG
jgi:two-component system chemotaxis response regulator CheY